MTIICKNDVPHPRVVKETVCPHCGVTLQFLPKDVKERMFLGIFATGYFYIKCCRCSLDITIDQKDIYTEILPVTNVAMNNNIEIKDINNFNSFDEYLDGE